MPELARVQRLRPPGFARDLSAGGGTYVKLEGRVTTAGWTHLIWFLTTSTAQQHPCVQQGSAQREAGIYLDTSGSIGLVMNSGATYIGAVGGNNAWTTNKWQALIGGGDSAGYIACSRANGFTSGGTACPSTSAGGTPSVTLGYGLYGSSMQLAGAVAMFACWDTKLDQSSCLDLVRGAAPWKVRRDRLKALWAPQGFAAPDIDRVYNRQWIAVGSPKLTAFTSRGLIRP